MSCTNVSPVSATSGLSAASLAPSSSTPLVVIDPAGVATGTVVVSVLQLLVPEAQLVAVLLIVGLLLVNFDASCTSNVIVTESPAATVPSDAFSVVIGGVPVVVGVQVTPGVALTQLPATYVC